MSRGGSPWKEKGKDQTEIRFPLKSPRRGQSKGFTRGKEAEKMVIQGQLTVE
jgi:hypothetical protein